MTTGEHDEVSKADERQAEVPKADEPKATEPKTAEPRTADPKAAEPNAVDQEGVDAEAAELSEPTSEPKAADAEPRTAEPEPAVRSDVTAAEPEPAAPQVGPTPPLAKPTSFGPLSSTRGRVLVAAALVVLIGLGVGGYWYQATHVSEGVAFRVYGQDETIQALDNQVRTLGALYGVQPPTEESRLDAFRRDVAKSTAMSMIIDRTAADRKIVVADRQATDTLARYVTQYHGQGIQGRDAFVADLANKGTSEPKVLAEIKRQMIVRELFNQVTADVKPVTDEELRTGFETRGAELATPERREIHNIVVKTPEDANQVIAALKAGANFEALARQRSLDGSTKSQGGNLGLIAARQLEKPFADAAFATPVGGMFGPVQSQFGYNVAKVVQAQPAAPAEFDKVKDGLRQLLFSERVGQRWREFLAVQIEDADVVYADSYRPADPTSLPSLPQAPSGESAGAAPAPAAPQAPVAPPGAPAPNEAPR